MDEILQKARGKTLAHHFTKSAAFHEKKADHHEKCMKAHEGAQDHHEKCMGMGKADDPMHDHHKAKAAFHKTMASHHEKAMGLHKKHAEHHAAMAAAHGTDDGAAKAAFTSLGIELEAATNPPVVNLAPVPTGEPIVSKTTEQTPSTAAAGTVAAPVVQPTATAALAAALASDNPLGEYGIQVQKAFNEGVATASMNAVKELLASPEFKKTIQEEVANTLLKRLGEQAQTTHVKTFAVPRVGTSVLEIAKSVATGNTPVIDTTGVSADFSDLVSMGSE